jgi:hypothetical protein
MAHDACTTMITAWSKLLDCAFKTIKSEVLVMHIHVKNFIVVISTLITLFHINSFNMPRRGQWFSGMRMKVKLRNDNALEAKNDRVF